MLARWKAIVPKLASVRYCIFLQFAFFYAMILLPVDNDVFRQYIHLGQQYYKEKQFEHALYYFAAALPNRPNDNASNLALANKLLQLGNCFFNLGDPDNALTSFRHILTISSTVAPAHHNIGFTLSERLGKYDESLSWYERALEFDPKNPETHFCYALSLLATGNMRQGFQEYEWRWRRNPNKRPRSFAYPLEHQWCGQDIRNKRILLHVEQGLGDTLQFIRYAQLLKNKGAIVIAEVQHELADILATANYIDEIVPIGSPLPPFDYQIPLLSLPAACKTAFNTIPANIPYLYADPALVTFWKYKLPAHEKYKIGICWQGDSAHSSRKFMPFDYFIKLAQLEGVSLYSLQKGVRQNIDSNLFYQFDDSFDETHGRFTDTAAVMQHLDLVITVDTSVAHLAGALGVPVWVILPYPAEWRWLTDRENSPWYPTMRLFRQTKPDDWQTVFDAICKALTIEIQSRGSR